MAFSPEVNQEINIFGDLFSVVHHPLLPDIPYGQEGRQAIVYSLMSKQGARNGQQMALKVFKPRFQSHRLIKLARDLTPLAQIPGLSVCHRTVLTQENSSDLIAKYPELNNAMLMPWIVGPTWLDLLIELRELSREQSLGLARSLVNTLADMERMGIAHCDLSAANILIPGLVGEEKAINTAAGLVELVDVEQICSSQLEQPDALPGGSPGYAHAESSNGLWNLNADRFAGAVLLAEILAWCSLTVRNESWGESYFDPNEMQKTDKRYLIIKQELKAVWGEEAAGIFASAWESTRLSDCPSFRQWQEVINGLGTTGQRKEAPIAPEKPAAPKTSPKPDTMISSQIPEVKVLTELGEKLMEQENFSGAIAAYDMALTYIPYGNNQRGSLTNRLHEIKLLDQQHKVEDKAVPAFIDKNPSSYCLVSRHNTGDSTIFINKDLFIIGRSQSADHIVMAAGISRIHMEFIKVQNRIAARDLSSTNGTYINGRRIEPYALYFVNNGDRIKLANLEYEFRSA